jgi:hypothetical protein
MLNEAEVTSSGLPSSLLCGHVKKKKKKKKKEKVESIREKATVKPQLQKF